MKHVHCIGIVLVVFWVTGCAETEFPPPHYVAERREHVDGVLGISATSPDGMRIVSVEGDGIVQIVDVESWEVLHIFEGHTDWVRSAQFSPDSRRIITSSDDKTIRILDAGSGRELRRFAHTGGVIFAAFSPDEQQIATGNKDGIVRLWDAAMERELQQFEGHTDWAHYIIFSPNGQQIATSGNDGTIRLWDVESGKELQKLEGLTDYFAAQFMPDGLGVIMIRNDGEDAFVWDFVEETE